MALEKKEPTNYGSKKDEDGEDIRVGRRVGNDYQEEKKAGSRSIGKERKITDEGGGGSNKFVVTFTCPLSTLPDCLLYFDPH